MAKVRTKENRAQNAVVLYKEGKDIRLDVRLENETVWLTQGQIGELLGTQRPAITKHLNNIFETGELSKNSVCSILEQVAADGKIRKIKLCLLCSSPKATRRKKRL